MVRIRFPPAQSLRTIGSVRGSDGRSPKRSRATSAKSIQMWSPSWAVSFSVAAIQAQRSPQNDRLSGSNWPKTSAIPTDRAGAAGDESCVPEPVRQRLLRCHQARTRQRRDSLLPDPPDLDPRSGRGGRGPGNGTGIPPDIRDRLFQPFFTTKPTGAGTGLGLSVSWDIVTQQHGGSIEVDSQPGKFTEFTIRLPRNGQAQGAARERQHLGCRRRDRCR
jgi:Histidine kinase-, DNA gyrase B-, and HSP90-like ATPase